jgi:hypothetical protein
VLINPFVVLANGGKTTVLEMGVLHRTEMFCNLLCNNQFGAVRGRTKENFSLFSCKFRKGFRIFAA